MNMQQLTKRRVVVLLGLAVIIGIVVLGLLRKPDARPRSNAVAQVRSDS